MKKINNKGMTTVEILVSFVLVVIITVSLYSVVSTYQDKQHIEAYKSKIVTYKNLLTKEIQDDLIKKGVIAASVNTSSNATTHRSTTTLKLTFRDGSKKSLVVYQQLARDYDYDETKDGAWTKQDDKFRISYGEDSDLTNYTLPDLGYGENKDGNKVYDLRIQNVNINTDDNILTIKLDLYHPDLENRYGLDIVCPINF